MTEYKKNNSDTTDSDVSFIQDFTVFTQHFEEVVDQAEEKTQGYNLQEKISQLQDKTENNNGVTKIVSKVKALYHQSIYSFARNDGYVDIGPFNLGWMMPQFLTIGLILSIILEVTVSQIFVISTIALLVAIPVSIYFLLDVFDYFANEQITRKPTKILYALCGVIPVLGVIPFHFRSDTYQNKSLELFIKNNKQVISQLTEKYT